MALVQQTRILNNHQSAKEEFPYSLMRSQHLLRQMGKTEIGLLRQMGKTDIGKTDVWSGSLVYIGVTIWHGKQALTLSSVIRSMHGNHTFSLRRALVFTIPMCPSWAMLTIRSCNDAGTTIRSAFRSKDSVQVNCSLTFS